MSFTCDVQELAMQFSAISLNCWTTRNIIQRDLFGFDGVAEA